MTEFDIHTLSVLQDVWNDPPQPLTLGLPMKLAVASGLLVDLIRKKLEVGLEMGPPHTHNALRTLAICNHGPVSSFFMVLSEKLLSDLEPEAQLPICIIFLLLHKKLLQT